MLKQARKITRSAFKMLGYELVEVSQRPLETLCGLGSLPIKTVIDVGANVGQFSRYVSEFFPKAQIHAFEPLPPAYESLNQWARESGCSLKTYNKAVGSERGTGEMQHHIDFTPSSSILDSMATDSPVWQKTRVEKIQVEVTTLDDEFPNGGGALEKDILLKLDVQGFEDRVLSGAKRLLPACSIVIVEHCTEQLYSGQAGFDDIYRHIQAAGLEYIGNLSQHHAKDGKVVFADIVFRNCGKAAA